MRDGVTEPGAVATGSKTQPEKMQQVLEAPKARNAIAQGKARSATPWGKTSPITICSPCRGEMKFQHALRELLFRAFSAGISFDIRDPGALPQAIALRAFGA